MEGAALGENIARRAAMDDADMHGRIGRIETAGRIARRFQLFAEAREFSDEFAGGRHGIGAEIGFRGMRLKAVDNRVIGRNALMRVGDLHQRRLADEYGGRPREIVAEARDRIERPLAGDLFVIAQQNMDRP